MPECHPEPGTPTEPETPYTRIGGGPAVTVAVDMLYQRILTDPHLAPYFIGVDLPGLKRHMALMLTKVLGGPDQYRGRSLAAAHTGLGITDSHYLRVCTHLAAVCVALDVPDDIIAAVAAVLDAVRPDVVATPDGSTVAA